MILGFFMRTKNILDFNIFVIWGMSKPKFLYLSFNDN